VNRYAGFPQELLTDQGSQLVSEQMELFAKTSCIDLTHTPTESHNSLGLLERYHTPLRNCYNKLKHDYPGISDELALSCAVKAANDTMESEGIVPTTLLFGIIPRVADENLPSQSQRSKCIAAAREEMSRLMALLKGQRALRHQVPRTQQFEPGKQVLVCREGPRKWVGPCVVSRVEGRTVYVHTHAGEISFSVTQLKLYRNDLESVLEESTNFVRGVSSKLRQNTTRIHVTETIQPDDPRARDPKMLAAKRKEIEGLLNRGTFRIVLRSDIPQHANKLSARYVLAIKDPNTDREVWKARLILGGHRDLEKHIMVRSSTTVQQRSLRLLFALAAAFGWKIWTQDITQAYLQSSGELVRKIYVDKFHGVDELDIAPDEALQLLRPLYGLADSGDHWWREFNDHHRNKLNMATTSTDASLYYRVTTDCLNGLTGVYVDDTISAGTPEFDRITQMTENLYEAKPKEYDSGILAGIEFKHDANKVVLSQER
jgi:hypothetical protein